ncbi:deoxyribodipyrimidine photo-lyase [bacterium]|nr:deoxyribodipyrimidine photo-lyase [bacterium]
MTAIIWFRNDLRLSDNPALVYASKSSHLIPVYILDTAESYDLSTFEDPTQRLQKAQDNHHLHHSLFTLHTQISRHGNRLILRSGDPAEVMIKLVMESGATVVVWNESATFQTAHQDSLIRARLESVGVQVMITTTNDSDPPVPVPTIPGPGIQLIGEPINRWQLLPQPHQVPAFSPKCPPGEIEAIDCLKAIIENVGTEKRSIEEWELDVSDRLGLYLKFGELSRRVVGQTLKGCRKPLQ